MKKLTLVLAGALAALPATAAVAPTLEVPEPGSLGLSSRSVLRAWHQPLSADFTVGLDPVTGRPDKSTR